MTLEWGGDGLVPELFGRVSIGVHTRLRVPCKKCTNE
jgi:hypothetical protein